jgi:hypothetical protein
MRRLCCFLLLSTRLGCYTLTPALSTRQLGCNSVSEITGLVKRSAAALHRASKRAFMGRIVHLRRRSPVALGLGRLMAHAFENSEMRRSGADGYKVRKAAEVIPQKT